MRQSTNSICQPTNNIERRLLEHQLGLNRTCYTYKRRPVTLVFTYQFSKPGDAIDFEKQIKGWRRAKKEALIAGEWDRLPELSKSYSKKTS